MTKALPNFKSRVTAFEYVGIQTIRRALQLAFAFVAVILVTAFAPI